MVLLPALLEAVDIRVSVRIIRGLNDFYSLFSRNKCPSVHCALAMAESSDISMFDSHFCNIHLLVSFMNCWLPYFITFHVFMKLCLSCFCCAVEYFIYVHFLYMCVLFSFTFYLCAYANYNWLMQLLSWHIQIKNWIIIITFITFAFPTVDSVLLEYFALVRSELEYASVSRNSVMITGPVNMLSCPSDHCSSAGWATVANAVYKP
jgi:hypothetical protein